MIPAVTEAQRREVDSWLLETLETEPRNSILRLKLAYLRMKQGRSDEAEALYRTVLAESPGETEALNNLASLVAFHDGPRDEALSLVDRAIAGSAPDPPLLDTRALVHIQMNQPQRAIADLERVLATTPNDPIVHFHLARAHDQMGNRAEARSEFELAEELGLKPDQIEPVEREEFNQLRRRLIAER